MQKGGGEAAKDSAATIPPPHSAQGSALSSECDFYEYLKISLRLNMNGKVCKTPSVNVGHWLKCSARPKYLGVARVQRA